MKVSDITKLVSLAKRSNNVTDSVKTLEAILASANTVGYTGSYDVHTLRRGIVRIVPTDVYSSALHAYITPTPAIRERVTLRAYNALRARHYSVRVVDHKWQRRTIQALEVQV